MLSEHISATEDRYLREVKSFCTRLFKAGPCSHGTDHHERVWRNAIGILSALEASGINISGEQTEALFFASWFHDTGLVYDKSEAHGKRSKEIFNQYVADNKLNIDLQKEIEAAILLHDKKELEYTGGAADTATILSVADDMDSFGAIGIYRYLDIYKQRGILTEEIPERVLKNVGGRFENLNSVYCRYPDLVDRHSERFRIITDFFEQEVNALATNGKTGTVMEYILKNSSESIDTIISNAPSADPQISSFISALKREYTV